MNEAFLLFLSLSLSGSLIALLLFLAKPLLKDRMTKTWQYYIYLIVVLRLIVPFGLEVNLVNGLFAQPEQYEIMTDTAAITPPVTTPDDNVIPHSEKETTPEADLGAENTIPLPVDVISIAKDFLWFVWLVPVIALFLKNMLGYLHFTFSIKASSSTIKQSCILETYRAVCGTMGIKRPPDLVECNVIAAPMLIGTLRPVIALPDMDINDTEWSYILRHELTHYRRLDVFYKWLMLIAKCLHWYNPLVYWVSREINRNCELSCDEAIIRRLDKSEQHIYGDVLLNTIRLDKTYSRSMMSMTLNEDTKLIKERLGAIMKYKRKSKLMAVTSALFAVVLICGAAVTGAYAAGKEAIDTSPVEIATDTPTASLPIGNAVSIPTSGYNQIARSLNGSGIENIKIYAELCTLQIEPTSSSQIEVVMAYPEITSFNYENRFNLRVEQQNNNTAIISTDYDFQYGFDPIAGYDINSYPEDAYLIIKLPSKQYTSVDLQSSVLGNSILEYSIPSSLLAIDINAQPNMVLKLGRVYDDLDITFDSGTLDLQLSDLSENTTINLSNCMFALTLPSDPQDIDFSITTHEFTAYALPTTWTPVINGNIASYRAGSATKVINIKTQYTDFEMRVGNVPSQRGVAKPETSAGSSSDLDVPSSNTVTSYSSFYDSSFAKNFGNQVAESGNYFGAYRIDVRDNQGYDHQAMIFICNGTDSYKSMFNEALNGLYAAYPNRGQIASYLDLVYDNSLRNFGNSDYFATEQFTLSDANGVSSNVYLVAVSGSEYFEEQYDNFFEAVIEYYK